MQCGWTHSAFVVGGSATHSKGLMKGQALPFQSRQHSEGGRAGRKVRGLAGYTSPDFVPEREMWEAASRGKRPPWALRAGCAEAQAGKAEATEETDQESLINVPCPGKVQDS